jgi:prepilin-type N-terminal cleavage/methylation domain-containing protein
MRRSAGHSAGFTLLEVMMAITVLAVGMLALAGLISRTSGSTDRSRYMSMAGLLASEKLEELTRLPASEPAIAITSGDFAGSLTANIGPVAVGTATVNYFDEDYLSSGNGNVNVTTYQRNSVTGIFGYYTLLQGPDAGTNTGTWSATPPAAPAGDMLTFERRWVIEDSALTGLPPGARRITVLVRLLNTPIQPQVTFQMSTVRQ